LTKIVLGGGKSGRNFLVETGGGEHLQPETTTKDRKNVGVGRKGKKGV